MKTTLKAFLILALIGILFSGAKKIQVNNPSEVAMISEFGSDKLIVQTTALSTAAGFGAVFTDMISDSLERVNFIREYIAQVRYFDDLSGYFYVEDFNGWNIAHPLRDDIVASYRYDVRDVKGNFYHHDMCKLAKTEGQGFVSYYFNNPATNKIEEKKTYIAAIPGTDYFIGTGFYVRSTKPTIALDTSLMQVTKNYTHSTALGFSGVFAKRYLDPLDRLNLIRTFIKPIRFFEDKTGYFFVNHINGFCMAHALDNSLMGMDQSKLKDTHGKAFIKEMGKIAADQGSGFVSYYWINPNTGASEKKISYIERIPGTDLYIGSGVYLGK